MLRITILEHPEKARLAPQFFSKNCRIPAVILSGHFAGRSSASSAHPRPFYKKFALAFEKTPARGYFKA